MRKKLTAIGAAFALTVLSASTASALAIGDANYVGVVIDGIPSNDANEPLFVNSLIQVAAGVSDPTCNLVTSEICNRVNSTLAGPLPEVDSAPLKVNSNTATNITVNGWDYISGKYGNNGIYVWYIGNLAPASTVFLPSSDGQQGGGLSHWTLYNARGTSVPDGGATVALLGMSVIGLGMLRRKINL